MHVADIQQARALLNSGDADGAKEIIECLMRATMLDISAGFTMSLSAAAAAADKGDLPEVLRHLGEATKQLYDR